VLRQYAHIVWRRFWIVVVAVGACLAAAFWYTETRPVLYRATASVEISFLSPTLLGEDIDHIAQSSDKWAGKTFLETQYKILKSWTIALQAAKRLETSQLRSLIGLPSDQNRPSGTREVEQAAEEIREQLEIEPVKDSRIVLVKYSHTDPNLAAAVANSLAGAYIDDNLSRRLASTKGASLWLHEQLETLRRELDDAEVAIHGFKRRNNILSVSLEDRINILSQRIETLSEKSDQAMTERLALEAQIAQLERIRNVDDPINDPALSYVKKPVIEALKKQYVEAYMKLVELRGRYMEKHPSIQAQQALLAAVVRDLEREAMLEIEVLEAKQRALAGTEARYDKALAASKKEGIALARKAIEFNRLKRDKAHTEKLYETVLERFKETGLAKELRTNNVRLVDRAVAPAAPYSPRPTLNLAIGVALGLLIGIGLAFLLHYLDNTVKTQEDIELTLHTPSLGWIPSIKPDSPSAQDPTRFPELYLYENPKSPLAEACRSVRTNLLFMSAQKPLHTLLVTSSAPKEGKTTVAANLATVMAMAGSKTVIVDSDMRRPRLHKTFGVSNEKGLTHAVSGQADLDQVVKSTDVPHLDILPRGPATPNPAELLHSEAFHRTLAHLKQSYDRIIFDSPPIQAVTDPVILSTTVDGTILVLKAGITPKELASRSLKQLNDVNAAIVGCILNDLNPNRKAYGYGASYPYYRHHRRDRYYYGQ
jgi:capsular exopolysaccharide synthesis family protein